MNYLVNEEPGSHATRFAAEHGPCASSHGVPRRRRAARLRRAPSRSAPNPPTRRRARSPWTCPPSRASAARCSISSTATAPKAPPSTPSSNGSASRDPQPAGEGLFYLDHLTHNVGRGRMDVWVGFYERLFNFREIRFFDIKGEYTGLLSPRADQPGRQHPHPDQRERRRAEPDRGIPARLQRRGHPAHRLRLPRHLRHDRAACARAACRSCRRRRDTYYERIDDARAGPWRGRRAAASATAS